MKKKWVFYCIALLLAACSDGNDESKPNPGEEGEGGETNTSVVMEEAELSGFVFDAEGNSLSDVKVTTGSETTFTNETGAFRFSKVGTVDGRSVLKFTKDEYFEVVRSAIKEDGAHMKIVLYPRKNSDISLQTNFTASTGKELEVGGMKVNIPASGVVVEATGKAYSGNVKADMLYLNPENENFSAMMPGSDMAAIRTDNSSATLLSYGMVNVNLKADDGTPLQLKEGTKSKLTFPIPEGMKNNPPATIPLWYFDEEKGIWAESGTATLNGSMYVGDVAHFSYYNLDVPEQRVRIYGTVTDTEEQPVPFTLIHVGQTSAYTDAEGNYSTYIPANNAIVITVFPEDYGYYNDIVKYNIPPISGNGSYKQDIILAHLYTVSGTIVNTCLGESTVSVALECTIKGAKVIVSHCNTKSNGHFLLKIPENYAGPAKVIINSYNGDVNEIDTDIKMGENEEFNRLTVCFYGGGDPEPEKENVITFEGDQKAYFSTTSERILFIDNDLILISPSAMKIKSYSSSKTKYENIEFITNATFKNSEEAGTFIGNANVTVKELSKSSIKFDITAIGNLHISMGDPIPAMITSATITAPIYYKAVSRTNIQSATELSEFNFPTFWNGVPYPADYGELIKEDYGYAKGGTLYYKNKTKSDIENLKSSVGKLGFTLLYDENETYSREIVYQKEKQVIMLNWSKGGIDTMKDILEDDVVQIYNMSVAVMYDVNGDAMGMSARSASPSKRINSFHR